MKIENASQKPKVYYGLHFAPGVAEYKESGEQAQRIFLNEETLKKMDATFAGCPVYVQHVEEVDLKNIQHEADGYVVESFYNNVDGKHWAKFIIVSDKGHEAISKGWKLSNCYVGKTFTGGGEWHGVSYQREVTNGEFEHLAIVDNPRYSESIVLSPEQFKEYNNKKSQELSRIANSKESTPMSVFKFFKKERVENATDLEATSVQLPESKEEKTIAECIAIADKFINMQGYCNMDHMVKLDNGEAGVEEMSVNDLVKKHMDMKNELDAMKKKNADLDSGEKEAEKEEKKADLTENAKLDSGEKEGEEQKKAADKTENSLDPKEIVEEHFKKLMNAGFKKTDKTVDLDKLARGKKLF